MDERSSRELMLSLICVLFLCFFRLCALFIFRRADATDTAAGAVAAGASNTDPEDAAAGGTAIGIALGLGAACSGGLYVLNAKASRNK